MWIRGELWLRLLNAAHSWQTTCYLLLTQASTDESGEFTPRHLLTFHTGGGANIFVSHVGRSLSYLSTQAEFASRLRGAILEKKLFLDAQASLAPTHVRCPSVRRSVRPSHFRISNLSASLLALRERLKREDPNIFFSFGSGCF